MGIISKLAFIDWLAIGCLSCLMLLIIGADSSTLRRYRRVMGLMTLGLAGLLASVPFYADMGDSVFFGQFANDDPAPKKKKGRQSAAHHDGRKPEEDPSGPGDGDGGAGEEVKIEIGGVDTPEGDGLPGGAKQNKKKKNGGGAADGNIVLSADAKDGGGDEAEEEGLADPTAEEQGTPQMLLKRDCPICPALVQIPAGSIVLGADKRQPGYSPHEGPARRVKIRRPFLMGRTEVTRAEFAYFLSESGYRPTKGCVVREQFRRNYGFHNTGLEQTDDHPAVCVSYVDAKAYVAWLSKRTGLTYRLPREVEWEYAARGGASTNFAWGEDATAQLANFADLMPGTTAVGHYRANGFGLQDMAGNVWELVEDCWSSDRWAMEQALTGENARRQSRKKCNQRVMKGGAWYSDARHLRPAARWPNPTATGGNGVGFRVVREIVRARAGTAAVQVNPDDVPAPAPVTPTPVALPPKTPSLPDERQRDAIVPAVPPPASAEPVRTPPRRVERPVRDTPVKTAAKPQANKRRSGQR